MMGSQSLQAAPRAAVISHATPDEIPTILDFIQAARKSMFPMLNASSHRQPVSQELETFQHVYLEHPDGAFLVARVGGVLVATIGYVPYDYRFPELQLGKGRTVEVVRLYVDPDFRRTGLASRLYAALSRTAWETGIEQLYLHTHPFLPGAVTFWERNGFSIIQEDQDPVWRTIHMRALIDRRERHRKF